MVDLVLEGSLTVQAEEIPLADVAVAWQRQRDSPNTKLVLRV